VSFDEFAHHPNAFRIVQNDNFHAMLAEQIFSAPEVFIFSDDNARNAKEQSRSRAHDARAERADQSQFCPIASATRIAKADRFGMRGRISALNPQVVPTGDNLAATVCEHRTDWQTSFAKPGSGLMQSLCE
jgi:hypothetical protein